MSKPLLALSRQGRRFSFTDLTHSLSFAQVVPRTVRTALVVFSLLYLCTESHGQTWRTSSTVDSSYNTGDVGTHSKTIIVNGLPAIAYYDIANGDLLYMRANDVNGTSWGFSTIIDTIGNVGMQLSIAIVNGNPAIAYYDNTNGNLKYVRATDANGTTWGTPIAIDTTGNVGQFSSLCVVNGNPAISYYDATGQALKYVRATDADGSVWGSPQTLESGNNRGRQTSMCIVNGNPAIGYIGFSTFVTFSFIRANDPNGSTWGSSRPVIASTGGTRTMTVVNGKPAAVTLTSGSITYIQALDVNGSSWPSSAITVEVIGAAEPTLSIVDGNPAIAYYALSAADLKYSRANDANGSSWQSPATVLSAGSIGRFPNLCVVNGNPAISSYDVTNGRLNFVRATDVVGTSWGGVFVRGGAPSLGTLASTAIVDGFPAMAYFNASTAQLVYVRATNATGTTWGTPVTIDAWDGTNSTCQLLIVNGNPAIVYCDDNSGVMFARASNATGTLWNAPVSVSLSNPQRHFSSCIVNGNPAISYWDGNNSRLRYIRATDVNGTGWGSVISIEDVPQFATYPSLAVVNGNPALSYYNAVNGNLNYIRSTDVNGSSWGNSITIDSAGDVGINTNLKIIDGNPAISYGTGNQATLKYIRATDVNGTNWGTAVIIASASRIGNSHMERVNGKPVIVYGDAANTLRYIRASNASGSAWAPVVTLAGNAGGVSASSFHQIAVNERNVFVGYYKTADRRPVLLNGSVNIEWNGTTTDWHTTTNWLPSTVPTSTENVDIPGTLSIYPVINSGNATCNNLNIFSTASVTVNGGGSLAANGAISNAGTLDATNGTIVLNGTLPQSVPANTFSANTVMNLTLNNSSGATLGGPLNITGTYTPTQGVLATGGFLTLKSGLTGTARIAAGSSTGGYITGNVTVERYVPAKRAWRMLTSPLTGSTNNSIFANWQNNGSVIANTGMELWASAANGGVVNPGTGNSGLALGIGNGILTYISGSGWSPVTNTNTTNLFNGSVNNSYCVFVTGPFAGGSGNISSGSAPTVYKATGTLRTGDVTVNAGNITANLFYLVGNPFASPVNPNALSGTNLSNSFYMWDANLTGNFGNGGYVTYNRTLNQYNIVSGGYSNSPVSQIQSGQAFFIQAASTGPTSILFEETDKSSGNNNAQFRNSVAGFENLRITLQKDHTGSGVYTSTDGIVASFHATTGSRELDYYDVRKMNSGSDLLSLMRSDTRLTFEHRPLVTGNDTLYLNLSGTTLANYRFQINTEDFASMAGLTAVLKDNYLNTETAISLTDTTRLDFSVTTDAASSGNRFVIYFRPALVLPVDFVSVNAQKEGRSSAKVSWQVSSERDVASYIIERSIPGNNFERIGTINAANTSNYQYIDVSPANGTNYYRIRSVDVNGSSKFSNVASVTFNDPRQLVLYPNPVKGDAVELRMMNADEGRYTIRLICTTGQIISSSAFDHHGGPLMRKIDLPKTAPAGIYRLEMNNGKFRQTQPLVIQ